MRPVAGKIEWTDKELYEDLPRALKALRDSQGLGTLKSKKIVGVIWEEKKKQWLVRFSLKGRQTFVGRFNTYEEAVYQKVKAIKETANA